MKFIAYDLGTGGVKASLYDNELNTLSKSFIEYRTYYPQSNMHEQRPEDWWSSVVKSTKILLEKSNTSPDEITCIALSGHSCVAIPINCDRKPLFEYIPIWSDTRAEYETKEFFSKIDETTWYMSTGNGFPSPCYSLFKLMWYKKHFPDIFSQTYKVVGSKDYINLKLTGEIYTDHSYASGSGAYDLIRHQLRTDFLEAADISIDIFPEIVPSHQIIGQVTFEAAEETGLRKGTLVACGGVDNACMALGAIGPFEDKAYVSLGSSSWIPVNSRRPILDPDKKPYVFAHIEENMYTSAFSIFSGGSSFRWIKETLCKDLVNKEENTYDKMSSLAKDVPIGSNGIIFIPSLAGGTSQDKSINVRGSFVGLHLGTTREDMIRASMEGIALNLKVSLDYLTERTELSHQLLFCGGGSKSDFWMQMFADIFDMDIIKTNIDQDAASTGAAAICAKAMGLWKNYEKIKDLHHILNEFKPNPMNVKKYRKLLDIFKHVMNTISDLGDYMHENAIN